MPRPRPPTGPHTTLQEESSHQTILPISHPKTPPRHQTYQPTFSKPTSIDTCPPWTTYQAPSHLKAHTPNSSHSTVHPNPPTMEMLSHCLDQSLLPLAFHTEPHRSQSHPVNGQIRHPPAPAQSTTLIPLPYLAAPAPTPNRNPHCTPQPSTTTIASEPTSAPTPPALSFQPPAKGTVTS